MPSPFISRTDLSAFLDENVGGNDFALACIDAACDACRAVTEQTFNLVEDDSVVLDGMGTDALLLPERPVVEVGEVSQYNSSAATWLEVDAATYALNDQGCLVLLSAGAKWSKGRQNFSVTYTHGYAPEDFPRDVRMVALSLAARTFQQGVAEYESIGQYSVRYAAAGSTLTVGEKLILRKYRQAK